MKVQLILEVKDEAYPHILYLLKHMEGVKIVEDSYTKEKKETLYKEKKR